MLGQLATPFFDRTHAVFTAWHGCLLKKLIRKMFDYEKIFIFYTLQKEKDKEELQRMLPYM